ncbi:MAG: restriction endonuclease subunit S, partial [Cyanobacteria bacterium P01_A01_bin.17]
MARSTKIAKITAMEDEFKPQLPSGWLFINFKDSVTKVSTNGKKIKQKEYLEDGKIPVIDQGQEFIGGFTNKVENGISSDSPILVFGDHTKVIKLVNFTFAPGADGVKVLRPSQHFLPRLLESFIKVLIQKIPDKGYARHFQHLEKTNLPLPPIAEQQRIVDKIEELFSDLDSGINSLKTARQQLKVYRQAVLKWAFEGKLTTQWSEEQQRQGKLASADTLLAQIKAEREQRYQKDLEAWQSEVEAWEANSKEGKKPRKPKAQRDISPLTKADTEKLPNITTDWQWIKVGLLLLEPPSNGRSVKDKPGGFRVLRLTCIKQGAIDLKENKEGDWDRSEAFPYIVRPGDFLISRGNGSIKLVGRGGVVTSQENVAYPDTMVRLPINQTFYIPKLFSLIWNSDFFRKQIEKAARTTAGIHKINQNHILNFAFPLISLSEQEQIVEEMESRLSICDQLEADIETTSKKPKPCA